MTPGAIRRALLRIAALFHARSLDRDLQEELDAHVTLATEQELQSGHTPEEARRRALLKLGGMQAARERHRDARAVPWMEQVWQDVTYALRGLRRQPGFAVTAVLILALGIGVNTAVFSIVRPLLLHPLPFPDADRLIWISPGFEQGQSRGTYAADVFEALKTRSQSYSDLSAYWAFFGYGTYTLTGRGPAKGLAGTLVAPRFFELLGIEPTLGRLFSADEATPTGPAAFIPSTAVISHAFWQRRFGADRSVVGSTITINDSPVTVVGVLPKDFDFGAVFAPAARVDLFMPAPLTAMVQYQWGSALAVVGRLREGITVPAAQAEMDAVTQRLRADHPEWGAVTAVVTDLATRIGARFQRSLALLWGAVGLVLLIAGTNLSNLFMVRTTTRAKEIRIRLTLGASRSRVVRQLLIEGVVLALAVWLQTSDSRVWTGQELGRSTSPMRRSRQAAWISSSDRRFHQTHTGRPCARRSRQSIRT